MAAELPLHVDPYPSRRRFDYRSPSVLEHGLAAFGAPIARHLEGRRADALLRAELRGDAARGGPIAQAIDAFGGLANPAVCRAAALMFRGTMVDSADEALADTALAVAAAALALRRPPVHIVTVTADDAAAFLHRFGAQFRAIGSTARLVEPDMPLESRRDAYAAAIAIVSVDCLAQDALRDRYLFGFRRTVAFKARRLLCRHPEPLIPGFRTLLCRDAGALLLDRAHTPVVLRSGDSGAVDAAAIREALAVAGRLSAEHFAAESGATELTEAGRAFLAGIAHLYPALAPATESGRLIVGEARDALAAAASGAPADERLAEYRLVLDGRNPGPRPRIEEQDFIQRILARYQWIAGYGAGTSAESAEIRDLYGVRRTVRIGSAPCRIRTHAHPDLDAARADLLRRYLDSRADGARPVLLIAPGGSADELPPELSAVPRLEPGASTDGPLLIWGAYRTRRSAECAVRAAAVVQVVSLQGLVPERVGSLLALIPVATFRVFVSTVVYGLLRRAEERRRAKHRRELASYAGRVDRLVSFAGDSE